MKGTAGLRRSTGALAALLFVASPFSAPAGAQPTPPQPASPQPTLPKPLDGMPLASPIIGGGKGSAAKESAATPPRDRRHRAALRAGHRARHRFAERAFAPLERPALAGVELVAPLPVPVQPPHFTVPVPAYLPENAVTAYTTPLPPVICHRVPRDPYAPDPHLIRETTVLCEADNP